MVEIKTPKVTLVSWTERPLETIYSIWDASKTQAPTLTAEDVERTVSREDVLELFKRVIKQGIPVGESISFNFMLEGVSVSWREQAARHRIGARMGDVFGVDVIPDLAQSSWWSQSMRILDMSHFADNGDFRVPQTIIDRGPEAVEKFQYQMKAIQDCYAQWVQDGIPMEDARELIPLGAHHRISWSLNMSALRHIVGKRSCWILQAGIWGPVMEGMVKELGEKVDPVFWDLTSPPCMKGDDFVGCPVEHENERRLDGRDELPVCPLYMQGVHKWRHPDGSEALRDVEFENEHGKQIIRVGDIPMLGGMRDRAEQYRALWNRDPYTGARLHDE